MGAYLISIASSSPALSSTSILRCSSVSVFIHLSVSISRAYLPGGSVSACLGFWRTGCLLTYVAQMAEKVHGRRTDG